VTREQLLQLRQIIRDHSVALAIEVAGPSIVPEDEIKRLVSRGILDADAADALRVDYLGDAYTWGQVVAALAATGVEADAMTSAALLAELVRKPITMTSVERDAIDHVRLAGGDKLAGLGNRFADRLTDRVHQATEAQRRARLTGVRSVVERGIDERRTSRQVATDIARDVEEWTRDVDRVAVTELQDAHNEGTAAWISKTHGGGDARVAKVPDPGACRDCRRLYLHQGVPRIFQLRDLSGASNYRRPRAEWVPTLETTHPWCHCTIVHVPEGFVFGADWILVPEEMTAEVAEGLDEYRRHLAQREAEDRSAEAPETWRL